MPQDGTARRAALHGCMSAGGRPLINVDAPWVVPPHNSDGLKVAECDGLVVLSVVEARIGRRLHRARSNGHGLDMGLDVTSLVAGLCCGVNGAGPVGRR